jgi:hypothetical protein
MMNGVEDLHQGQQCPLSIGSPAPVRTDRQPGRVVSLSRISTS